MNTVLKILALLNGALMVLPMFRFGGTKYLPYFIVLAILDPIFLLLHNYFRLASFHYMPISVCALLFALPVKDKKFVLLAIALVILALPHINDYYFLAPLATVTISALTVYYFIEQILHYYKDSKTIPLFLPVLILCTIVDSIKISLYYSNLQFLANYYIWFLIFGLITTLLLFYFGSERKLQLKSPVVQHNDHPEEKIENPELGENLHIYKIDTHDLLYELTKEELQVLELLGKGYKCSEIAEKVFRSKKTVYYHISKLKEKLNIDSISRLEKFAIQKLANRRKNEQTGKSTNV